ncbi:site-specific integrase [Virgibacillus sp.]|uniref:tyrosine-type recombinase/integrase n=1 Tax=Virgibacillus sp. TaxID=1872700 RepID=UPI0018592376|nr:site-specific integrase [Virgibacillus sp.]NWO14665.1 site-specific integrase [Virgibacillus sp.]
MAGSVENRGKGKWRLTVYLGQGIDGKYIRKRKTVAAKNKTEARKLLTAFENEINSGEYIEPTKIKFSAFVEDWRNLYANKHFAAKTLETYNYILDSHILPTFGHKKLESIQPIHITKYLNDLETARKDKKEGKLSTATIYKHYAILRSIFNYATNHLRILKKNPVTLVPKPKVESKKYEVYTDEEVDKLFALLDNELIHYALMVKIAILGGLRRGEILGLLWENVNFEKNTIQVQYSLNYTKQKGYELKPPKNGEERTITLPSFLMDELKEYNHLRKKDQLQAFELWNGKYYNFVFSTQEIKEGKIVEFGKPFYPGSVSRWWTRFLNRTKFKAIRFHDLRHTAATLLINEGLHAKHISSRLGHADIQITMNTYGHYLQEADQNAANILEQKYGKKNV